MSESEKTTLPYYIGGANIALHLAAACGHSGALKLLITAAHKDHQSIDIKNDLGQTPLLVAAACNQPETLTILLEAGADYSVTDNEGNTAIDIAKMGGACYTFCSQYKTEIVPAGEVGSNLLNGTELSDFS